MALRALRNAVSELKAAEMDASARDEALRRAYPIIPERVLEDTADYDYSDPNRSDSPVDWHYRTRFVVCRCMRVAYEEGETWLVEVLEEYREHESAQLAAALANHEEWEARRE